MDEKKNVELANEEMKMMIDEDKNISVPNNERIEINPNDKISNKSEIKVKEIPGYKILINKLSYNVKECHLEEIFGEYGKIKKVDLFRDRITKMLKGYANVEYYNKEDRDKAILYMDGAQIDGKNIRVFEIYESEISSDNKLKENLKKNGVQNYRTDKYFGRPKYGPRFFPRRRRKRFGFRYTLSPSSSSSSSSQNSSIISSESSNSRISFHKYAKNQVDIKNKTLQKTKIQKKPKIFSK